LASLPLDCADLPQIAHQARQEALRIGQDLFYAACAQTFEVVGVFLVFTKAPSTAVNLAILRLKYSWLEEELADADSTPECLARSTPIVSNAAPET